MASRELAHGAASLPYNACNRLQQFLLRVENPNSCCCGGALQEYIQDETEHRVLREWAHLQRSRQEAAQAIEIANVRASFA